MWLVDSNILIYAHDESASNHAVAKDFISELVKTTGFALSPQIFFETTAILTDPKRVASPLDSKQVDGMWKQYMTHPKINILSIDSDVVQAFFALLQEYNVNGQKVFDVVLAATAIVHGLEGIYTNNTKDFEVFKELKTRNPLLWFFLDPRG